MTPQLSNKSLRGLSDSTKSKPAATAANAIIIKLRWFVVVAVLGVLVFASVRLFESRSPTGPRPAAARPGAMPVPVIAGVVEEGCADLPRRHRHGAGVQHREP